VEDVLIKVKMLTKEHAAKSLMACSYFKLYQ
jgi:hypothetical protein